MQHLDFSIQKPVLQRKKPFLHSFPPLSLFSSLCLSSFPWYPKPRTMIPFSSSLPQFLTIASTRSSNRNCRYLSVSFSSSGRWKSRNIEVFGQCPILTIRPYLRRAPNPDSTRLDPTRKKTLQRGNWAGCERKESKTDRRRKGDG